MTAGIDNIGAMIRDERLRRGMTQDNLASWLVWVKRKSQRLRVARGLQLKL